MMEVLKLPQISLGLIINSEEVVDFFLLQNTTSLLPIEKKFHFGILRNIFSIPLKFMGEKLSETGSAFCGLPSFVCLVTGAKAGSLSLHSPVEPGGPGLAHFLNELFLLKHSSN